MEIAVLDALTLGNDVNLKIFEKYGNLTIFKTTSEFELDNRISNADIVISNKVVLNQNAIEKSAKLKLICVAATGYNNINIEAARRKGIVVSNVRNYSTEGVAQHTFSLILALENSLFDYVSNTRSGLWAKSPVFTMLNHPFNEIKGKKLGIIGYGSIGRRVAEIARAFGMHILIGKRKGIVYEGKERMELDVLFRETDILTIHTPLSDNTLNLITMRELELMKTSAILINVARGGIVNEKDLYAALKKKTIRAAAIDVSEIEPIKPENPLPALENLLITPHMAWASYQSRIRLIEGIMHNIDKFINGQGADINLAI